LRLHAARPVFPGAVSHRPLPTRLAVCWCEALAGGALAVRRPAGVVAAFALGGAPSAKRAVAILLSVPPQATALGRPVYARPVLPGHGPAPRAGHGGRRVRRGWFSAEFAPGTVR